MKLGKRLVMFALSIVMLLCLCSCGGNVDVNENETGEGSEKEKPAIKTITSKIYDNAGDKILKSTYTSKL